MDQARIMLFGALCMMNACSGGQNGSDAGSWPPDRLPFEFTRTDVGEPLTQAEIDSFTQKITGFWKDVDLFGWALWHAHGLHASYDANMPEYGLWWQDTIARKQGDLVTFVHVGGADNLEIRTSKLLAQAVAGYLASGDAKMGRLAELLSNGIVALFQGLLQGPDDPDKYVTARSILTHNHSYTDWKGRKVAVDYDPAKVEQYDWNAHTVPNPNNPVFGSIWVRNMRSKDDLPHLFRVAPILARAARDAKDPSLKEATQQAWDYLKGFAKDIVDHGYQIRTKENGQCYVPEGEDLASFVMYDELIPNAECDPKLTVSLLAYGGAQGLDCGSGISPTYEQIATSTHYYNYAIVRYFHLTAILHAILAGRNYIAEELLAGLVERVENMLADEGERAKYREWDADGAAYLVAAATCGLPLTSREARLIQERYSASADFYRQWPLWDLYDTSVADGDYDYASPPRDAADAKHIRLEEMTFLIEYCYSPFRNPAGVKVVNCDVVLDPQRWGE